MPWLTKPVSINSKYIWRHCYSMNSTMEVKNSNHRYMQTKTPRTKKLARVYSHVQCSVQNRTKKWRESRREKEFGECMMTWIIYVEQVTIWLRSMYAQQNRVTWKVKWMMMHHRCYSSDHPEKKKTYKNFSLLKILIILGFILYLSSVGRWCITRGVISLLIILSRKIKHLIKLLFT